MDQFDPQPLRRRLQSVGDAGDGERILTVDLTLEYLHVVLQGLDKTFYFVQRRFDVSLMSLDERIELRECGSLFGHDACYRQLITR